MNLLILDNDECLGYFGFISNMYGILLGNHFLSKKIEKTDRNRILAEKLFIKFSIDLLNIGFARPNLSELFHMIKDLKQDKIVHYVIMYTSASRNDDKSETPYVNWVRMLRKIFEKYSRQYKPEIPLYDIDHSGRSDENPPRMSRDGATQKSVDVVVKRLGLLPEKIENVIFMDDRTENIYKWEEKKLVRLRVTQYFHLPEYKKVFDLCEKYDKSFNSLGLVKPSDYAKKCYDEEVEDMQSENKQVGGNPTDNDGLDNLQLAKTYKTLFTKKNT